MPYSSTLRRRVTIPAPQIAVEVRFGSLVDDLYLDGSLADDDVRREARRQAAALWSLTPGQAGFVSVAW